MRMRDLVRQAFVQAVVVERGFQLGGRAIVRDAPVGHDEFRQDFGRAVLGMRGRRGRTVRQFRARHGEDRVGAAVLFPEAADAVPLHLNAYSTSSACKGSAGEASSAAGPGACSRCSWAGRIPRTAASARRQAPGQAAQLVRETLRGNGAIPG